MLIPTVNQIEATIAKHYTALSAFSAGYPEVLEALEQIPKECITLCYFYPSEPSHHLIINLTTREAFAPLRALRPRWEKSYAVYGERGVVTYRCDTPEEFSIVCEVGELPPSCQLVETIIEVPATEARTEVRRKIKCNEPKSAEQAAAAQTSSEG